MQSCVSVCVSTMMTVHNTSGEEGVGNKSMDICVNESASDRLLFTSLAYRLALNRIVKYKYVTTSCHFKAGFMTSNTHTVKKLCQYLFCKEEIFSNPKEFMLSVRSL